MSQRYFCIHGHFYQPPRENPWLEHVEQQDGAYPFHDWNERITAECYGPNAASRILDSDAFIERIVNNYSRISFNFGPTLLSWLQAHAPEVYEGILQADRGSSERFSGHGSALAQAYNHMIMPLASWRDKVTQVLWGLRDFTARFGRRPEGMWLPETAVDLETLEILAAQGLRFTILAPHQAARVRRIGGRAWRDVSGARIDTTVPYLVRLKSGGTIAVFFYDGPTARAVAFEGLLNDGIRFAERVLSIVSVGKAEAQLAHIATDGETYGHHHRYGDMALAYALHYVEREKRARLTNYGEMLERHPPANEVEIIEGTSWSCAHGIERWRSDCGCRTGDVGGSQAWRGPLRDALDWLRDRLVEVYERHAGPLLADPWAARDAYIDVVLDRSPEVVDRFLAQQASHPLSDEQRVTVLELMEMQRHAMLMFTSCGWFFDELSRIETVQILRYAARAVQIAELLDGAGLEEGLLGRLAGALSNLPASGDGRQIYETRVRPSRVDLEKVVAHFAVRSLFDDSTSDRVYCYRASRQDYSTVEAGQAKLAVGRVRARSEITRESRELCFAVLHFGDHTLNCGVHAFRDERQFRAMVHDVGAAFERGDIAETVRLLDRHFDGLTYSLGSLFRDEQRRLLDLILAPTVRAAEESYAEQYRRHAPIVRFLSRIGIPPPRALHVAAEFVLNNRLRQAFDRPELDLEKIHEILDEVRETAVGLEGKGLGYVLGKSIERSLSSLKTRPTQIGAIQSARDAVAMARSLPFETDFSSAQTIYYEMMQRLLPASEARARDGDEQAARWAERFRALGEVLRIRVP